MSISQINNTVSVKLSPRLSLIASMVPKGVAVCDVGTDHGLLPAYLYLKGDMRSVSATDINEAPLERARRTVAKYKADGVNLILCDGLEEISPELADAVIIAGMGGEVISGIIDRAGFLKNSSVTLILQAMTGADELRLYLAQNGFRIEAEPCVCEHGKVWSVMLVKYDGIIRETDPLYLLVGEVSAETPEGTAYIKKQYDRCAKCAESLSGALGREAELEYWQRLAADIKRLLEK